MLSVTTLSTADEQKGKEENKKNNSPAIAINHSRAIFILKNYELVVIKTVD